MKWKERLLRVRDSLVAFAFFTLVAGFWLAGEVPSSDAAWQAEANLPELPLKETVSQYGITWTFDEPASVGQFVNGDYYIVGPVTVVEIEGRLRCAQNDNLTMRRTL